MGINLLDEETINKIAAGEVIERPASIVKELAENAVDAGASAVTIEIRDGGQSLIRVTDNGCGIPKEEVRTAFLRHATSKIKTAEDLSTVMSLGFRGEALSSIAAVARTEIITKTRASLTGTRYVIEGGEEKILEEVGAPEGTTMIVRDLFFRTPVRKKFMKSAATEAAHVSELAEQLALSHPEVSFRLIVNGQNRFHTSGNSSIRDIIYQLYGRETSAALIEIRAELPELTVSGFLGKPEVTRGSRAMEHYCINGRYIKSSVIAKALEDGYGNLLMQHSFPFCVLHISVDPMRVDVNVHPTKREVRFSDPQHVHMLVSEAVRNALHKTELIRTVSLKEEKKRTAEKEEKAPRFAEPFEVKRSALEKKPVPEVKAPIFQTSFPAKKEPAAELVAEPRTEYSPEKKPAVIERDGQLALFKPEHREKVRLVGIVFDTYMIAEWNGSMYIIDQHAAHEKVNYERLMKAYKAAEICSQQLMPPLIITLTDREGAMLEARMEDFSAIGYEIEHFGGHEYAVRAVPDILPSVMKDELLKNMIGSLSEEAGSGLPQLIIEKTASLSCKAAIKGKQHITAGEAEVLLDELFSLDDPYNCPHGRPTVIRLTEKELEKRFKRIL